MNQSQLNPWIGAALGAVLLVGLFLLVRAYFTVDDPRPRVSTGTIFCIVFFAISGFFLGGALTDYFNNL